MNLSDYYVLLALGVVVSLLIEEFTGVSPGGMITPGVLAINIKNVDVLIYIFLLSLVIHLIVDKVLSKYMILYGKRKFAITIVLAMLLKLTFDQFYGVLPFATVAFRGAGAIVPALLANTYSKQGIEFTVPTAIISMFIVALVLELIFLF